MRKYVGIIKSGFKVAIAYRFEFFVTLITAPISLIVFYFLWKSIFEYTGVGILQGFTFTEMVSYYLLNLVVGFFTWSRIERWMEEDIRYGHMIKDLLKPVNYFFQAFYFELGLSALGIVVQAIPFFIIGLVFFDLVMASWINIAFFVVSLLLAHILYFLISYIIGLTAFWFQRIEGLSRAKKPIIHFLSGGLIPLTFMPLMFQDISKFLPFQYIRFIPISFYLGKYELNSMFTLLAIQVIWVLLLYTLAHVMWNNAFKKFAGAGA
ncbi:MAG: ABC-2 family transporter protein [Nanoarchaeota archaeon]|nr:ABC-2 family transporter protein [Nanoarchaeota archaeon]